MGSFNLFARHSKQNSSFNNNNKSKNPPGFRYEYSQPSSSDQHIIDQDLNSRSNTFSKWFKFNSNFLPHSHSHSHSPCSTHPSNQNQNHNRKLSISSFALPIAKSFSHSNHNQINLNLNLKPDSDTPISPINLNHPLHLPISHAFSSSPHHPSLANLHSQSDPLPTLPISPCPISLPSDSPPHPHPIPSLPHPPSPPKTDPSPNNSSRHSRKPLQLLGAKLRPTRRQTSNQSSLTHKHSTVSLAVPPRSDTLNLIPHPRSSLRAVSSPTTPVPTLSDPSEGSFELRSFRNVRSPPDSIPPPPLPPSSRPSSVASSSRPASPSPRISAAAFREARAARSERASVSSLHSDLLAPPPTTLPDLRHARFQTAPAKAVSDSGHGSPHIHSRPRPRPHPQPLIHQIPARQAQALAQPPSIRTLAPLNDHDILVPPRPAFYGSRPPPRSLSADMGSPISYQLARPQSTRLPFVQHNASGSHASVRSLPLAPTTLRRTSVATSVHEQRQLDQWHSDDDEESSTPAVTVGPTKSRDEEDDEVPLSRLRKKSVGSVRDCAAAETLARGRQQLQSLEPRVPPSPLRPASHVRRASGTSASSGESGRQHPPALPPLPARLGDGMMMLVPVQGAGFARGNSPTASSSSGSGSGTWSMPHTPHDSTGNVCSVASGLQKGRVMFSAAPHEAVGTSSRSAGARSQMGAAPESPTNGLLAQSQQRIAGPPGTERKSIKEEAASPNVLGPSVWSGVPVGVPMGIHLGSPGSSGSMPLLRINDLGVPAGVDPYLYAALGEEQKLELHRRSQMMMQMMAAQAQAAVQMHALALSSSQGAGQPGSWLGPAGGSSSSEVGSRMGRGWGSRPGRSEMGVGTGVSSVGASGGGGEWGGTGGQVSGSSNNGQLGKGGEKKGAMGA